jgi:predicted enzyme related to lactoylglutathione lyase
MARPNYIELPASDIVAARAFYTQAFGWELTDFGPTYACTMTGDVDIGLQGNPAEATRAPLPVIAVDDLEAALAAVTAAGARIVRPIFAFPGGRRFRFLDPHGNELAVMQADREPVQWGAHAIMRG